MKQYRIFFKMDNIDLDAELNTHLTREGKTQVEFYEEIKNVLLKTFTPKKELEITYIITVIE